MPLFLMIFNLVGIAAFAATGALVAGKNKMDLFGALTLAFVTGIGGGTMRDLLLDTPVFWIDDTSALWACLAGFLVVFGGHRLFGKAPLATINFLDAIGLAVFSVLGASKALELNLSPVIAILMGFLTGCGGGILRDILANEVPFVLAPKKLYATPSLLGAIIFVLLQGVSPLWAMILGASATFIFRMAAVFRNWHLPEFPMGKK